jgi:hypothetical protein
MGPGTETPDNGATTEPGVIQGGEGSLLAPPSSPAAVPGAVEPFPGAAPTPAESGSGVVGAEGAAQQEAPVTFTVPGGYGGGGGQTFTLGEGRLSKPPVTFTFSTSEGYDDNLYSATAHPVKTPAPTPGPTPPLERRLIDFFIGPPVIVPIFQYFRPKAAKSPTPAPQLGVIGSPASTITLSAQVQRGSPRTVFTMDLAVGADKYWERPGPTVDYNGNFDLSMVHRLSPRATLSMEASTVYSKTPNFSLINAPTNNGNGGAYLNGDLKSDLSYSWGPRISTVTSYDINFNLETSNTGQDVYTLTYGTQVRDAISARNTVTAELRVADGIYPNDATADDATVIYLLGLDTIFSARLSNNISGGFEVQTFSSGAPSQVLPYVETSTTLALPRGGGLSWTNRYGSQESGSANQTSKSYRTGLTLSQPLSTKLVASISLAYNNVENTGITTSAGSYAQNELQASLSLGYNFSPRFSMNLSYTLTDLMSTQVNSSYQRQQVYLGGTYTFR